MPVAKRLTHLDEKGAARMVDVAEKPATAREAIAECTVRMSPATIEAVRDGTAKGDALQVAQPAQGCGGAGQTGVEMEALTAAAVAGLTLIDMTKAVEKGVYLENVRLLLKSGGRSGTWRR